ncbi:MAG TPA: translation initiation factor IF-2 subunit beta [archaeon]|nr:translation initiation factor IF-2 subunit beta [archaeon]
MDYEHMLDRIYLSLPKEALSKERFQMIEPDSFTQGSKTIVKNFSQIIKLISRDSRDLMKYLSKESATSVNEEDQRLIINGKFAKDQVSKWFTAFVNEYVLCHACRKPDTKIDEQKGVKMLKCTACGALNPIKKI